MLFVRKYHTVWLAGVTVEQKAYKGNKRSLGKHAILKTVMRNPINPTHKLMEIISSSTLWHNLFDDGSQCCISPAPA